jgi:predicted glycoside hydrolase/deacetylase ChbG (UPF0249 family)
VRRLIVNADDFGYTEGINRGVVECHTRGVLTSASLMVTGHAVGDAVALGREHPALSVGLHFDVWGEDERDFDTRDVEAVRDELHRQLDEFHRLTGRGPTHVDSHRHVHREPQVWPVFAEVVEPLGIPLRGDGRVAYVGGFYAQWEWRVTDLRHVSVAAFERLLAEAVDPWTELGCHPGHVSDDQMWVYHREREEEIRTLTDPRLPRAIAEQGLVLASYADWPVPAEDQA